MKFTEEQKQVIFCFQGPMMVLACPGSGKTMTIIGRAAVLREKFPKDNILIATFSKNAERQMQERYENIFGKDNQIKWCTLHSLALEISRELPGKKDVEILTESERRKYFSNRQMVCGYSKEQTMYLINKMESIIYNINTLGNPNFEDEEELAQYESILAVEIPRYQDYKKCSRKKDYNDMLFDAIKALNNQNILERWQHKYKFIMIDEAQDMDIYQAQICYRLAASHRNICLIGDDDQSIYGFRTIGVSVLNDFVVKYPEYRIFDLGKNFRCPIPIVESSAKLISNNKNRFDKKMQAFSVVTNQVQVEIFKNFWQQTYFVVETIKEILKSGVAAEQIAILCRTNRANELIAAGLNEAGLQFHTSERIENYHENIFFNDILAYWRLANGKEKNGDLQRIIDKPRRGYLNRDVSRLSFKELRELDLQTIQDQESYATIVQLRKDIELLNACHTNKQFLDTLGQKVGYLNWADKYIGESKENYIYLLQRLESAFHQGKMKKSMEQWEKDVLDYRKVVQQSRESKTGISMCSFHAAKGLEWDYVFIINAIEGQTPFHKAIKSGRVEQIEEERRNFYVAVTRARKQLFITGVEYGKIEKSRFIDEMKL